MDRIGLQILADELRRDGEVLASAATMGRQMLEDDSVGHLPACGYELNRFYNILERCFERVTEAFENHFDKHGDYHERLIGRMTLEIHGIRPAFLPENLLTPVRELKGFRHVFRHAYDLTLESERLAPLVAHAEELATRFPEVCAAFISQVTAALPT